MRTSYGNADRRDGKRAPVAELTTQPRSRVLGGFLLSRTSARYLRARSGGSRFRNRRQAQIARPTVGDYFPLSSVTGQDNKIFSPFFATLPHGHWDQHLAASSLIGNVAHQLHSKGL